MLQDIACITKELDGLHVLQRRGAIVDGRRGEKGKKSGPKECLPEGMDECSLAEGRVGEGREGEGNELLKRKVVRGVISKA